MVLYCFVFFKQKTAYEMRISDWSSDVCSSDLATSDNCPARRCSAKVKWHIGPTDLKCARRATNHICSVDARISTCDISIPQRFLQHPNQRQEMLVDRIIIFKAVAERHLDPLFRSEEHTSELQSLMRISYAV